MSYIPNAYTPMAWQSMPIKQPVFSPPVSQAPQTDIVIPASAVKDPLALVNQKDVYVQTHDVSSSMMKTLTIIKVLVGGLAGGFVTSRVLGKSSWPATAFIIAVEMIAGTLESILAKKIFDGKTPFRRKMMELASYLPGGPHKKLENMTMTEKERCLRPISGLVTVITGLFLASSTIWADKITGGLERIGLKSLSQFVMKHGIIDRPDWGSTKPWVKIPEFISEIAAKKPTVSEFIAKLGPVAKTLSPAKWLKSNQWAWLLVIQGSLAIGYGLIEGYFAKWISDMRRPKGIPTQI